MSTGTKKIRKTVRKFGRFISERLGKPNADFPDPWGHYSLRLRARQRAQNRGHCREGGTLGLLALAQQRGVSKYSFVTQSAANLCKSRFQELLQFVAAEADITPL